MTLKVVLMTTKETQSTPNVVLQIALADYIQVARRPRFMSRQRYSCAHSDGPLQAPDVLTSLLVCP